METKTPPVAPTPQHNLLAEVPQRRWGKIIGLILGGVAALGLIAGGYWYFIMNKPAPAPVVELEHSDGSDTESIVDGSEMKLIFYGKGGLVSWENGEFNGLFTSKDSLFGATLSPDGSSLIVGHYNYDQDGSSAGLFGSGINTLKLVSLTLGDDPKTVGQEKGNAKWDFRWSPDSEHVAYVVNDGAALEILNIKTNKVVAKSEGKDTTPVQWLSENSLSFVQDGKLYLGRVSNLKEKIIAEKVDNSLCAFESPPILVPPLWSPDGNYVGFYRANSYIVKELKGTREASLGALILDEGPCGDVVDISPIGWGNDNKFYFADFPHKSASVFDPAKWDFAPFSNGYAHPDSVLSNISPDSRYMVFPPHDPAFPYLRITEFGDKGNLVCNNEHLFTGTLAAEGDKAWSNLRPGVVVLKTLVTDGFVYTVFDVKNCKLIESIMVNKSGEFGDNLDFVGIQ